MRMTRRTKKSVINNHLTTKPIKSTFVNTIQCTNGNLITEAFGEYFSEVAGDLEAEIPQTIFDPLSLIVQQIGERIVHFMIQ